MLRRHPYPAQLQCFRRQAGLQQNTCVSYGKYTRRMQPTAAMLKSRSYSFPIRGLMDLLLAGRFALPLTGSQERLAAVKDHLEEGGIRRGLNAASLSKMTLGELLETLSLL